MAADATYPALAPPAPPRRPQVVFVGALAAAVAASVGFAGLLGTYLAVRADTIAATGSWLPDHVSIPLTPVNMAAATLVMSMVTMQWAVYAIGNDDRPNTYVALGVTGLLGLAYINVAVFLYTQMGAEVAGTTGELLIYAISGAHLIFAGAGLVFIVLMAFRTLGGQYSGRDREGLAAAALVWHVMVLTYLVIWYAIYITK